MSLTHKAKSPYYWVDITVKGKRIRESTGTTDREEAQRYHDQLKAKLWDDPKEKLRYTWQQAVVKYINEATAEKKPSLRNDLHALRWADPYLGDKYLDEIDKAMIDDLTSARQKPYTKVYATGQIRECRPGIDTVNRFLSTIRAVLYKARDEWEWIDRAPKVKAIKGAVGRIRWITRYEADRLIALLPPHLAVMAEFSLQTGLRRTNVTHLEWSQVDIQRKTAWVHPDQAKNRKALAVPLSEKACLILIKQRDIDPQWVFPFRGSPVHQTSTKAWRDALKKAKIENFCWHDLRHTWASWHVQNGTPLQVLMELGGWSSIKMVLRYAHQSGEHLRAWVDRPSVT